MQLCHNLEHFMLDMTNVFRDEAGIALAEALNVNKTLRKITLALEPMLQSPNVHVLSAPTHDAFSVMLRVNTNLVLDLPPSRYVIVPLLLPRNSSSSIRPRSKARPIRLPLKTQVFQVLNTGECHLRLLTFDV
jgi:hypothetical protein